jgi:hypothetical protein
MKTKLASLLTLLICVNTTLLANERATKKHFAKITSDPIALRDFLYRFPKGGDLHNHIDGAIYAESMIDWAAEDGKCVNINTFEILLPPCKTSDGKPAVSEVANNDAFRDDLIDAFSIRNFSPVDNTAGEHFFSTFGKFHHVAAGREGDMLNEVTIRAARQNIYYLELMQSWNMQDARASVSNSASPESADANAMQQITARTSALIDSAERRRHQLQSCDQADADDACKVEVRYIAQVIRVFPREQVRAQTQHAIQQIQSDPRVVGLNFVAPEHAAVTLRDYKWQMQMIAEESAHLPESIRNISLHAGELTLGLVAPKHLGFHVDDAINVAGAKRIGHAIDVIYDPERNKLLRQMADQEIAVEINLSSNDIILGVRGEHHPFRLFQDFKVPMTLSTDDEGVSRIDLTHEYQRAVTAFDLSYDDLKQLARNALKYAFLPGPDLFDRNDNRQFAPACRKQQPDGSDIGESCRTFLESSQKANLQWQLERQFLAFESQYR